MKNDCFYLSDRSVGWIEAKKGCEGRGARLVSLETEDKMQNLLDWVSDKTRRRRSKYWSGGNDIEVEGAWEWEGTRAGWWTPSAGSSSQVACKLGMDICNVEPSRVTAFVELVDFQLSS